MVDVDVRVVLELVLDEVLCAEMPCGPSVRRREHANSARTARRIREDGMAVRMGELRSKMLEKKVRKSDSVNLCVVPRLTT